MTQESTSSVKGCLPKVSDTWRSVFESLNSTNRVHPSDPLAPKDSELVLIESKIKIRVVHLTPEKVRQSLIINEDTSLKRSSLAEEYWFMKNKPLRNVTCNCSFRRSLRNSNGILPPNNHVELGNTVTKTNHLDGFVEELVEETLNEAFNECLNKTFLNGVDNFAYEKTEATKVAIVRKKNTNGVLNDKNGEILQRTILEINKNCVHKREHVKPLIMLVHGLGCTSEIWDVVMHNLSFKGFEVVAPDVLGHGFSSAPNKASFYHFKNLLTQTMAVFDNYMKEDKRKCILIGHSYGCSLITALYPHRATKIAQLVLISGGGPTPLAPPAEMNDISPYGWAHNLCYPFMYCGLKRSFFYSSRGKNFKFCAEETTVSPHVKEFLLQGQYWPEGDASFHRRILVPTLLVHGLQDENVTLVQECEMERTIPRAFLELLPDAGHMSMLEKPEHLTHMITCFLEMWT